MAPDLIGNTHALRNPCIRTTEYVNPAQVALMAVTCGENRAAFGRLEDILSRNVSSAMNIYLSGDQPIWFSIDLGAWILPTAYTLRYTKGSLSKVLRNWKFHVSKDALEWTSLTELSSTSTDAEQPAPLPHHPFSVMLGASVGEQPSTYGTLETHLWRLRALSETHPGEHQGWRFARFSYFPSTRFHLTHKHNFCVSSFDIYGTVTGVADSIGFFFYLRFIVSSVLISLFETVVLIAKQFFSFNPLGFPPNITGPQRPVEDLNPTITSTFMKPSVGSSMHSKVQLVINGQQIRGLTVVKHF